MIKPVRISEKAVEEIQKIIVEEDFAPGSKFYSEHELAHMLEISRASVREALRMLEVAGRVTVKQGKGIYIADTEQKEYEAFVQWLRSNKESVFDHFEVRLMLDPQAASKAAKNATKADIDQMKAVCKDFSDRVTQNNIAGLISCDEEFHLALANATKNKTLFYVTKTMTQTLHEGWISTLHIPERAAKTCLEHEAIIQAVEEHDEQLAEKLMIAHLQNAIADVRASIPDQH